MANWGTFVNDEKNSIVRSKAKNLEEKKVQPIP
jgi:hypothetical protein